MISKSTATGREMTWLLFDNADEKLMLVKKKNNNGPKRKPAVRNLQAASESSQLTLPLPLSSPSIVRNPQVNRAQVSTKSVPPAFEPPPPYSPRQHCYCDNELSKPSVPAVSLPLVRIPPPLPPRAPSHGQHAVKSAAGVGKSCPDLARLVAKSVQNVKESISQEQDKKVVTRAGKSEKSEKSGIIPEYEKRNAAKSSLNAIRAMNEEHGKNALTKPSRESTEITSEERDKRYPPSKLPRPTNSSRHVSDQRTLPAKPCSPQTGLEDLISTKLDDVLTSIDGEAFSGDEKELNIYDRQPALRGGWGSASKVSQGANRAISSAIIGVNYFKKANLYANSRLPPDLPSLRLYMPSYPLLCLAAQYSQRVYTKPSGKEREAHVDANWKMGTKAMVIKSVPVDDMNTIVFAIRGSQTFMDWAVNLNSAPVSPGDFLDDPGNLCHSGFLSVARRMIRPVAARLRSLLEEDPKRSSCSLLMTGHSAGGAVASLLYAHMLAMDVKSELNILTGCFKRIHCLTFGAPPVSLLPLTKPPGEPRFRRSLFLSFINEGDPVPRADKAYIRSLLDLYTSPAPAVTRTRCALGFVRPKVGRVNSAPAALVPPSLSSEMQCVWGVPPGALSNAGRLVVLRGEKVSRENLDDDVRAEVASDQQLREVVFGDPVMHMMKVYARRIEVLAMKAVTAKVWG